MTRIFLLTVSNQHNAHNLILRILVQEIHVYQAQRTQRKIKNILFHTATATYTTQFYKSYILNNQTYKHNPKNQNNHINVGFTTNSKFILLQLRQRKFWSIHIQTSQISTNFVPFIHHQFCTFISKFMLLQLRQRKF